MKKTPLIFCSAAIVAAFSLTGCDTFKTRVEEKHEVYNALPAGTQKRLERGRISVGDTQDMVYIALGDPDEKRDVTNADNRQQSVWIYRTYWQQYEGTAWAGWRRVILPARDGRHFVIYHEPITQDIYRTRADEIIRVTFENNVVSSVEQRKR